jgi:hypothetical protein
MRVPHDSLGVALIVTVGPSILPGTPSDVRSRYWRAPGPFASALSKIFAQPVGRSRPFSSRSLVLAEGRPMPHTCRSRGSGSR